MKKNILLLLLYSSTIYLYGMDITVIDNKKRDLINRFECTQCDYASPIDALIKHIDIKHPEQPHQHKCTPCDYSTYNYPDMYNHMVRVHPHKKFTCICGHGRYVSYLAFVNHVLQIHKQNDLLRYGCKICNIFFSRAEES